MKSFISTIKRRVAHAALALLIASSSLTGFGQVLFTRLAHAAPSVAFEQGFETNTEGWSTSGGYGSIVRTNSTPSASGNWHALVSSEGFETGPFSKLGGYGNVWAGQWETKIAVYLDPAWGDGTGFDYSVSATGSDGLHRRDFIFHVAKDTSTGSLIVAGSNNTNFTVRQDLETLNHHVITSAGWYTLQHVFRDNAGVLAVDLNVRDSEGNLLFTETRSDVSDTIPTKIGGNRYAWFTVANVNGGVAVDDVTRIANPAPVTNITTGETFATIKAAVQDSDTVNGNTIEVQGTLIVTENTNINKDVTIRGSGDATIMTSGPTQLFTVTASGVTFENLSFVKTENVSAQIIIGVQSDNVTISNNNFTGQFVLPTTGATSRAIVTSAGADNLSIAGNSFTNLRQPAYVNNDSNGTISNNHVTGTRGWVVEKASNFSFTGNTWGYNSDDANQLDIAIIPGSNAGSTPNNYTCKVPTMKAQNNNAIIQDQAPASLTTCPNTPPIVTFNASTPGDNAFVSGVVSSNVTATDDWGMGSYYVRFWKDAFEVAGGGTLLHGCQSAPGAFSLGKTVTANCSYDVSSLPDGTKIVLSAQFLDGHTVWGMSKRTFTVDNTAPAKPVLQTPANGAAINYNSFWFEWDDVPGATSYEVQFSQSSSTDSNGALDVGVWAGDASHNQPIESRAWSSGANGTWFWQVRAVDAAGNKSAWTTPWSLTIDMVKPTSTHDLNSLVHGTVAITQTVSDNFAPKSGKLRIWKLKEDGSQDNSKFFAIGDVTVDASNQVVYSLNTVTQLFGDGSYVAKFTATDKAGNASVVEKRFVVDNTAPGVTITPINSTTDTTPEITGTVTGSDVDKVEVSFDNGTSWQTAALTGTTWSYQVTTPLAVGSVTVFARATDMATNVTDPVVSEVFTIAAVQGLQTQGSQNQNANDDGAGVTTTSAVLGAQDTNTEEQVTLTSDKKTDSSAVAGASDEKKDDSKGAWKLVGLSWYWWLLVLAAIIGLWWLIIVRKANTDKQ